MFYYSHYCTHTLTKSYSQEARRTSNVILDLYIRDDSLSKHLETFNLNPDSFDFNGYISLVKSKYYPEFV